MMRLDVGRQEVDAPIMGRIDARDGSATTSSNFSRR